MAYFIDAMKIDCDEETSVSIAIEHIQSVEKYFDDENRCVVKVQLRSFVINEPYDAFVKRMKAAAGGRGG